MNNLTECDYLILVNLNPARMTLAPAITPLLGCEHFIYMIKESVGSELIKIE